MTSDETESRLRDLPEIVLPVDRWQAMMRGMWRLLAGGIGAGGCFLLARLNWTLLWQTQTASFVALLTILLLLVSITLPVVIAAFRWLLVAAWSKPMEIRIGPDGIEMKLGPLGNSSFPWSELSIILDEAVDWEMLDLMPDDAFVPRVLHRKSGLDVGTRLVTFAGINYENYTRIMRPYLRILPCRNA